MGLSGAVAEFHRNQYNQPNHVITLQPLVGLGFSALQVLCRSEKGRSDSGEQNKSKSETLCAQLGTDGPITSTSTG